MLLSDNLVRDGQYQLSIGWHGMSYDLRTNELFHAGRSLDDEQISKLEKKLAGNPTDLKARIQLLGSYSTKQFESAVAAKARVGHIIWLVKNRPLHSVCGTHHFTSLDSDSKSYERVKKVWLRQTERHNTKTTVLANAASFYSFRDEELAAELLLRCKKLQPANEEWSRRLASLYRQRGPEFAKSALAETELVLESAKNQEDRFYSLEKVPEAAFNAGELEKANEAACELISMANDFPDHWFHAGVIQSAHTTLGRLALLKGERESAKWHLSQSLPDKDSEIIGGRLLANMALAEDLLKLNEKDAVLEYLDRCQPFCGPTEEKIIKMRVRIQKNALDLGSSLATFVEFQQACLGMELQQLQLEPMLKKHYALSNSIRKCEHAIGHWTLQGSRTDSSAQDAGSLIIRAMLDMHVNQLVKLKALLDQLDEP